MALELKNENIVTKNGQKERTMRLNNPGDPRVLNMLKDAPAKPMLLCEISFFPPMTNKQPNPQKQVMTWMINDCISTCLTVSSPAFLKSVKLWGGGGGAESVTLHYIFCPTELKCFITSSFIFNDVSVENQNLSYFPEI